MGKPLTEDRADDIVRQALKFFTDDVTRRLNNLEQLVREDLNLDREQKQGSPDSNAKLDNISSNLSSLRNEVSVLNNEICEMKNQMNEMYQQIIARLENR